MTDKIFVDSNIWLYIFLRDDDLKRNMAERFIFENGNKNIFVTSYQVINEVGNVMFKKKRSEQEIRCVIELLTKTCLLKESSKEIMLLASEIREKHSFSFWDSHIVASAVAAQCNLLVSEDMQDNREIGNLVVKNIFKDVS